MNPTVSGQKERLEQIAVEYVSRVLVLFDDCIHIPKQSYHARKLHNLFLSAITEALEEKEAVSDNVDAVLQNALELLRCAEIELTLLTDVYVLSCRTDRSNGGVYREKSRNKLISDIQTILTEALKEPEADTRPNDLLHRIYVLMQTGVLIARTRFDGSIEPADKNALADVVERIEQELEAIDAAMEASRPEAAEKKTLGLPGDV